MMLAFERFTKDNLRRVMQSNWNKTQYPLYGGSVLDPVRRLITPEETWMPYAKPLEIPNPLSGIIKKLSARQKDDDYRTGYFVFKNV